MKRMLSGIVLMLLLTSMLTSAFIIQPAKMDSSGTVYIRADGSIDPPSAPISTVDRVTYVFAGNIYDEVVVERSNIVIDGNGYTVQGTSAIGSKGIHLSSVYNVTVKNLNIKQFDYGIYLYDSSYNSIFGNIIANNYDGIDLAHSTNNSIFGNNITANGDGIDLYYSSSNNCISRNNITANEGYGIFLDSSSNNSISGNMFFNNGLLVWDSYGNVVLDNLVNGKPLVYLEDVSDFTVGDAGQVILVNCRDILVEGLNLSNISVGIQLWKTNNTKISGNNITANTDIGI